MAFLLLLLATLRSWVIGKRSVNQVQRKSRYSNNVGEEPGSVAKSGALLFPSHIQVIINICCRARCMLPSQITRAIESLASFIDTDFTHGSMKPYIMCPDMAFLRSAFASYSKLFCTRGYFKSHVKQNMIT